MSELADSIDIYETEILKLLIRSLEWEENWICIGFRWESESGMILCLYSFLRTQTSNATKPMVMPMNEQIAMLSRMKPMIRTMAAMAPKNTLVQ